MKVLPLNLSGLEDIVESQLEEEQVGEEKKNVFSVSQRKRTQQPKCSSAETGRKRRKFLNFSFHDPINIVDKEPFEVICQECEEVRETVKVNFEKRREKMK